MSLDLAGYTRKTTKVKLGGKDFVFTELTLADLGVIHSRVAEHKKATRAERRERMLTDAKAIKNIAEIDPLKLLEALDRPPTEAEYDAFAETPEGAMLTIYLSLKHVHSEIREGDAGQIVSIADMPLIREAMGLGTDKDEKKTPKTLKEKRSRGVVQSQSSSGSTKGQSSGKTSPK